MRALVTGGAGFIGSNLVDALLEAGNDVTVFDDLSSGKESNLAGALEAGAELVVGDVQNRDEVRSAVSDSKPDTVFHLAAQIDVRRSVADPAFDLSVNVGGTINLLGAAADSGVGRFVFTSTGGAIYGEGDGRDLPLTEDADARPDAPYGQSKHAAEGYLGLFARTHRVSTVALRLGNVYGPRQDPHGEAGVVAIFCGALLSDETPKVFGDGEQTRDYVFVGDVVRAFMAAAESGSTGPFNIGTGVETSVLELGRKIATAYDTEFAPEFAEARPGEVNRISISPARATETFGWEPSLTLGAGLRQTADWAADDADER